MRVYTRERAHVHTHTHKHIFNYQTCGGLVEEADERLTDEGNCHRQTPLHSATARTQHVRDIQQLNTEAAGHAPITEAAGSTATP